MHYGIQVKGFMENYRLYARLSAQVEEQTDVP